MPVVHGTGKCDASAVNHRARTEIRTNDPPALITPHPLPAGPIDPILTIGHSNHGMERFLELLHRHQVRTFIDVRTVPHSVRSEIQPDNLSRTQGGSGTGYVPASRTRYDRQDPWEFSTLPREGRTTGWNPSIPAKIAA